MWSTHVYIISRRCGDTVWFSYELFVRTIGVSVRNLAGWVFIIIIFVFHLKVLSFCCKIRLHWSWILHPRPMCWKFCLKSWIFRRQIFGNEVPKMVSNCLKFANCLKNCLIRNENRMRRAYFFLDFWESGQNVYPCRTMQFLPVEKFLGGDCWVRLFSETHKGGSSEDMRGRGGDVKLHRVLSFELAAGCCVILYAEKQQKGKNHQFCKGKADVNTVWKEEVKSVDLLVQGMWVCSKYQ